MRCGFLEGYERFQVEESCQWRGKSHEAPVNQAEVAICAATASVLGKDGGLWGAPRI